MKNIEEAKLIQACETFAVANTPIYLVRKLRMDQEVFEIGRTFSSDDILAAIRRAIQADPADLLNAVRPYAYLVALSMKPEIKGLQEAEKIEVKPWRWYKFISNYLLETWSAPVSEQKIVYVRPVSAPTASIRTKNPATSIILATH
jgi:hypothetical protein